MGGNARRDERRLVAILGGRLAAAYAADFSGHCGGVPPGATLLPQSSLTAPKKRRRRSLSSHGPISRALPGGSRARASASPSVTHSSPSHQRAAPFGWLQSRGSTGSLSSASTPKTHSWTRRSGSPCRSAPAPRCRARTRAAPASASPPGRVAQPLEVLGRRVLGTVDDAEVLAAAALHGRLHQAAPAARDEVERLDDHALAAASRSAPPTTRSPAASLAASVRSTIREGVASSRLGVSRGKLRESLHVPDVILVDVDARPRWPAGGTARACRSSSDSTGQQ